MRVTAHGVMVLHALSAGSIIDENHIKVNLQVPEMQKERNNRRGK